MKQLILLLALAFAAALLTLILTPASMWLARRVGALDRPGPRRLQLQPVPRLGGLAVVAPTVAILSAGVAGVAGMPDWAPRGVGLGILIGLIPILTVSVLDDIVQIRPLAKFAAHAVGATIAIGAGVVLPSEVHLFGLTLLLGWTAVPISFLWLTGVTNAFNLVDGLDGLSAGLGLISAMSLTAILLFARDPALATAVAVLAGSIAGFLPYNLHPAKVFLGDSGATAIGYLLACFTLATTALLSAGLATLIPVLLVGVPIADTLVAIARRTLTRFEHGSGNHIYDADSNHIHHRLLALGLSHEMAVVTLYAVGVLGAAVALASLLLTKQQSGYLLAGVVVAGLIGLQRLGYNEFALLRRGAVLRLYDLPVLRGSFFAVFVDIAMIAAALYVSIGLKGSRWSGTAVGHTLLPLFAVLTPTTVVSLAFFGAYRGSWRLAGINDFRRLSMAVVFGAITGAAAFSFVVPAETPFGVIGIYMFVALVLTNAARISYRVLNESRMHAAARGDRALIYGAGTGGVNTLREMLSNPAIGLEPVGFIDDDVQRIGKTINGYRIFGTAGQMDMVVAQSAATVVVVSSRKISQERVAQAAQACEARGLRLLKMHVTLEEVCAAPSESRALAPQPGKPVEPTADVQTEASCGPPLRREQPVP